MESVINNLLENTLKAYEHINKIIFIETNNIIKIIINTMHISYELKIKEFNNNEIYNIKQILLLYSNNIKELIYTNKNDKNNDNNRLINYYKNNNNQQDYSNILSFKVEDIYMNFFNKFDTRITLDVQTQFKFNNISFNDIKIKAESLKFGEPSLINLNFIELLKLFSLLSQGNTKIYIDSGIQNHFKIKHYFNENITFTCDYLK